MDGVDDQKRARGCRLATASTSCHPVPRDTAMTLAPHHFGGAKESGGWEDWNAIHRWLSSTMRKAATAVTQFRLLFPCPHFLCKKIINWSMCTRSQLDNFV